jgi:predicted ATPase/class 3 adenylate cyclase
MMGERRVVTILFCDVKGSTAMAEKLDPEEWAEIINQAFEFLIAPIYKYEGTLARLMGDSILAFFGAPIAHEDDALRAILAGQEIIEQLQPFRAKIKHRYALDFNVRVGINTGLVVVGGVGSDLFMEYTALGDAINIASRMEQTAKPGTIQIAENTYKKVAQFINVETIEGIEIKGKSKPLSVYRVVGVKETPVNLRGIHGLDVPLIGRSAEFEKLSEILDAVRKGRGGIVCMIGEAGLGKSRLLKEICEVWEAFDLGVGPFGKIESRWNQVAGVSYESTRPYAVIRRLIRNFIGLTALDSPETSREALAETLKTSGLEISSDIPQLFETLLGVKQQSENDLLEGERLKRAIYKELLASLDFLVQQGPTVIAIDDLHWGDETSIDFIIHLFQLSDRLPILFICSFRPDHASSAWRIKQTAETDYAHRYTEINLEPLSYADTNELIDDLFIHDALPYKVRKMILAKADGNPFFLEEVVRALLDRNAVVKDAESGKLRAIAQINKIMIPDTLKALLTARIDRLGDSEKHVLQLASVIGRSFDMQVLQMINTDSNELDHHLNSLQRLGLIKETAREPFPEFTFRQALTQETAYSTILLRNRKSFHRRVGEALDEIYQDRILEFASVIGHHFYQARDPRALKYYRIEGDAAFRLYANVEAVGYYSKAIDAALWAEEPDMEQFIYLFICRGRAYELNSQFVEAIENYQEMERLAQKENDVPAELTALIAQAQIRSVPSTEFDMNSGLKLIDKAKTIAEEINDQAALAKIYWITTNIYRFSHGLSAAQVIGEKAISIARDLGLEEQLAYSLTDTAHTYSMDGKLGRAREVSIEAVELWKKLNNQPMLADSLGGLVAINVFAGEFNTAYRYSDEAYEISQRIENVWGQSYSRYAIGFVDMERGDIDLAIQHFSQSLADAQASNFFAGIILTHTFLSFLYSDLGHYQKAIDMVDRVLVHQHPVDNALTNSFFLGAELLSRVRAGKVDEAEKIILQEEFTVERMNFFARQYAELALCYLPFEKGEFEASIKQSSAYLEHLHSNGVEYLTPELLLLIAKSQIALDRWHQAEITLDKARSRVEKLGSRRSQWQVDALLGQCALHEGDPARAAVYFAQSKENIDYIFNHISDSELREAFLKREHVKAVLEGVAEKV